MFCFDEPLVQRPAVLRHRWARRPPTHYELGKE